MQPQVRFKREKFAAESNTVHSRAYIICMKLSIIGYGNLGKSLEKEIAKQREHELVAIYSRRQLPHEKYRPLDTVASHDDCDVALIALGSYGDVLHYADGFKHLDTVDSFDTHAKIGEYKALLNTVKPHRLSIISTGWDPGLLSMIRGVFSVGADETATLWGVGVSQGHSNALRTVEGVIDAVQFTKPKSNAIELIKHGITDGKKLHDRICYVACTGADEERVRSEIVTMANYFEGYDTQVIFCEVSEIKRLKQNTEHRGQVVTVGDGFETHSQVTLECNTNYTAKIMLEYAKAVPQLKSDGYRGALDVFDVPLRYIASNALI